MSACNCVTVCLGVVCSMSVLLGASVCLCVCLRLCAWLSVCGVYSSVSVRGCLCACVCVCVSHWCRAGDEGQRWRLILSGTCVALDVCVYCVCAQDNTPLILAAYNGHEACEVALMTAGAYLEAKGNHVSVWGWQRVCGTRHDMMQLHRPSQ